VPIETVKTEYRDKIAKDSVFINDTIRVPYPVEVVKQVKAPLSSWQNFQVWCGRIGACFAFACWRLFSAKTQKSILVLP
jgi:hypothetical protein